MLAAAARRLGLSTRVFASREDEPAVSVADETIVGDLSDHGKLMEFGRGLEVVAFESDFIPFEHLKTANLPLRPALEQVAAIGCKWQQQLAIAELGKGLSHFLSRKICEITRSSASVILSQLSIDFPEGAVLKWKRGGYDGKGVILLPHSSDPQVDLERFLEEARIRGAEVFAESYSPFITELALTGVRTGLGEMSFYPLVISNQANGICLEVKGPATAFGVAPQLERTAQEITRRIGERFSLVGAFAVEFFLEKNGALSVNEIAPRVHNTSHYTQDACTIDQFENHWRALLNLGGVETSAQVDFFGMRNLLGRTSLRNPEVPAEVMKPLDGLKFHWYGKRESRPGRKMGHLNLRADSREGLQRCFESAKTIDNSIVY